jgi:drug/metabolite transporter (DMT)-like permease
MTRMQRMGPAEWASLSILSILWGGSFFVFKLLVDADLPPFTIVLGRVGMAAIALLAFVYLSGRRMPTSPTIWLAFLVMGLLNNAIPFSLIVFGETQIASGLASIFNAMTPICTVLLAHFLTDERLTPGKATGVFLGIVGVAVLIGPSAVASFNLTNTAQLACLGAAFIYGCAGIYGRRFRQMGVDPIVTATGQVCGSTIVLLPLAAAVDHPWALAPITVSTVVAWVALAVLSTALAYVIYFRILALAGATNLLLVTFLIPVSALLLGRFVLGEHLVRSSFVGMAFIFAGLVAIDGRPTGVLKKWLTKDPMEGVPSGKETAAYLAAGEGPRRQ